MMTFKSRLCPLLIASISISLLACTSMQVVELPFEQTVPAGVAVGRDVEISLKNGVLYQVHVTKVGPDSLDGRVINGSERIYNFPYASIQTLREKKVSAAKTGATIGIGLIVLYGVLIVAGAFVIAHTIAH